MSPSPAEPYRVHAVPMRREEQEVRLLTGAFADYVIEQVKQGLDTAAAKFIATVVGPKGFTVDNHPRR